MGISASQPSTSISYFFKISTSPTVCCIFIKYRILHFYKIRSASQRSAVTKYFQPAIGPKSIDSNSRSLSLADRQPLRTQTQPASQTSQPSRSSQPGRPSQHSIALPHSILYFCKISLACQSDRPPAWIFFIFTKYRILHFYKIPLHRPADRGPLRTQPSPVS